VSDSLVYPNEPKLARIAFVFSTFFWLAFVGLSFGIGLLILGVAFIGYCFAQSGFISYVRGNGVRVTREQLPELHQRYLECCQRLGVGEVPEVYVLNAHGILNALATRFLRRHYVVLFSDVLDALEKHPESIDFYLGHELGHIVRGHLRWGAYLSPARMLPLIGAAYSRAREYSCDLHGLACCDEAKDAAYGLAVLAAGESTWEKIDLRRYAQQSDQTGGFWMSYHELAADYPWLSKRVKRLMGAAAGKPVSFPSRHPLAWLLALVIPNTGAGAGGGAVGLMATVAVVGIVAAIAIPNFLRFEARAKLKQARDIATQVQSSATDYIVEHQAMPPSLGAMGLADDLSNVAVAGVHIEGQTFVLKFHPGLRTLGGKQIVLTPYVDDGTLLWDCQTDVDDVLAAEACGKAPAAASPAADAGAEAAPAPISANETTCSSEFRASDSYQALDAATQDALREACNEWKLAQLEAQAG
jgi:Zn-dependent protease with chaperone function/type II secretory pathway pseudopilin PulG